MSTDELIVQGFEWLIDYSQNYAENCRDDRCSSAKGTRKSLEQSFGHRDSPTETRQHQLTGQHVLEDSRNESD